MPADGYIGTVLLNFTSSNNTALANLCYAFSTMLSSGNGSVAVTGKSAVTTQLMLDTNASDCASPTTGSKPGLHPLRGLRQANAGKRQFFVKIQRIGKFSRQAGGIIDEDAIEGAVRSRGRR